MKTTEILFQGKSYSCRILKDCNGFELAIASLDLYNELHPGEWDGPDDGFANGEARHLDNGIAFYTDRSHLSLDDAGLIRILAAECPDLGELHPLA